MAELRDKMVRDMQLRNMAPRTQESYVRVVNELVNHYGKSPLKITAQEIEDYILYLRQERELSWNTCNVAICGIKFFFNVTLKAQVPGLQMPEKKSIKRLPVVYSREEVKRILYAHENVKHRVMLMVTYSGGLRASETSNLKITDIDSDRMLIRVNQGKGNKDRFTLLSQTCLSELKYYYRDYRPSTYLFPSSQPDNPIAPGTLNNIFRKAKKKVGIRKEGGAHGLRHSFATHLLESGYDIQSIQRLLGHKDISTTSIYLHVARKPETIQSPLDIIASTVEQETPWE
jgi:site-specific recombinase XerD